jgi:citrate lyase gamma subunit
VSVEPAIAFRVAEHDRPGLEVRINFGLLTGRTATQAEIDDLAHALRPLVPSFDIVSEERHQFGNDVEMSVHQVVIEIAEPTADLAMDVVAAAERWARACFAARHSELSET